MARRLPAEVLLDAINLVVGVPERFAGMPAATRATQLPDDGFAPPFLSTFGRPRRKMASECERSNEPVLAQALHLLNSPDLQRKPADDSGRAARWVVDPRPDRAKVEELYRVALSRPPTAGEASGCLDHLHRKRAAGAIREGYEVLIWAVVNGKEFLFNH